MEITCFQCILAKRGDLEAIWASSNDKKPFQITFNAEFGYDSNHIL